MKQNPLNGGHTYPVIQMHAYLLYIKFKFITLKRLSNTCNVLSRKLQSKYSLFLLPKSVMSALPHALDGLMQHAEVQWCPSIWSILLNSTTTTSMGSRIVVIPLIQLVFTSPTLHQTLLQLLPYILHCHWWTFSTPKSWPARFRSHGRSLVQQSRPLRFCRNRAHWPSPTRNSHSVFNLIWYHHLCEAQW